MMGERKRAESVAIRADGTRIDTGGGEQDTRTPATGSTQSRRVHMLANPEIKRWHDNLARGSPVTAEVRLRRLDKFCRVHSILRWNWLILA